MREFDIIRKYFSPLAGSNVCALGLKDDAAIFGDYAITTDSIVEDVHFFKSDTPQNIARKLLRVNLSDLASMSAEPFAYLLSAIFPNTIDQEWLEKFTSGLHMDIKEFGGALIGGDTVIHDGPLCLTLTAIGKGDNFTLRSGAQTGDLIYVTGTIGDSYLGLKCLKGEIGKKIESEDYFINRYHLPQPRLGQAVGANSCIDISDGLVADLNHICDASGKSAKIFIDNIPVSEPAKKLVKDGVVAIEDLITAGDDYELIFTAPPGLKMLHGTVIGEITNGSENASCRVDVLDKSGNEVPFAKTGHEYSVR